MDSNSVKILLVEDNNVARIMEEKTIQKLECDVDVAVSGAQAVDFLNHNHYDLVFMDISLPDMDGLQLTQLIRKHEGENQTVPIVALTAHGENEYQNQATWVGMDSFITKPLTMENCQKALRKFVKATVVER